MDCEAQVVTSVTCLASAKWLGEREERNLGYIMLDENTKGTRGRCLKLRKTRCTTDITRHFFLIGWSTDGTCWISGQSMHLT